MVLVSRPGQETAAIPLTEGPYARCSNRPRRRPRPRNRKKHNGVEDEDEYEDEDEPKAQLVTRNPDT
jgi:hypothetical protein